MSAAITAVDAVADPAELEAIVREYLGEVVHGFGSDPSLGLDLDRMAAATLGNLPAYLPPRGRLLLLRGDGGTLWGTCFLRMIRPDTAEMKRLFLRPAARGRGLGRALAARAVAEAQTLGARRVLLDTGVWMTEALALYRAMGFREIARYPESENPDTVADRLVYLELIPPPAPR